MERDREELEQVLDGAWDPVVEQAELVADTVAGVMVADTVAAAMVADTVAAAMVADTVAGVMVADTVAVLGMA
ncbi:MAG: hypothetical protein J7M25_18610 [Deltaproteobacteria bacterium]|nr:hypothetical protein [Deltaproteobacteria bacterium]